MCCRCVLLSQSEAFVYVPSSTSAPHGRREPGRGGASQAGVAAAAAAAAAAAEKRAALGTGAATVASMSKQQLIALIRQVAPPNSDQLPKPEP